MWSRSLCVAFALAALIACSHAVDSKSLGSWTLSGSDLSIVSDYIRAEVSFEVDTSVSKLTATATAYGPFPVASVTSGLISQSGSVLTVRNWTDQAASPTSGSVRGFSVNWTQFALPIALISALVVLTSSSQGLRSSSPTLLFVVAMVAVLAVSHSQTTSTPYVAIRIRIPSNFVLGSVSLDLMDGTVASTDAFTASSISINLCGDESSASATVSLDSATIVADTSVCAQGAVTLTNLVLQGSAAALDAESTSSTVSLSVFKFKGAVNLATTSGAITAVNADTCTYTTDTTRQKEGSCGSGLQSIKLTAKSDLRLEMLSSEAVCTDTYVDPPAASNVPISPAVSTTTRTLTFPAWSTDSFVGVSSYKSAAYYNYKVNASSTNALIMPYTAYYPVEARLYNTRMYAFRKGETSTLTFNPKINGASTGVTVASLTLLTLSSPPINKAETLDIGNNFVRSTTTLITNSINITKSANNGLPSVWDGSATVTYTLPTSTADHGGYFMLVIELSAASKNAFTLELGNFTFTSTFKPPSTGEQDGSSEIVTVYKMPSALDSNPRSTSVCPHLASGLKNWHDASTWPSGKVPSATDDISIPADTSVLISSCSLSTDVYERIHIPAGSKLVFSDSEISLRVKNIFVEGDLQMGAPTCRLNSYIDIEFVGAKSATDDIGASYGSKGIGVSGTIDIHGYQYHPTWTRLATSIVTGTDVIMVQDANNWEVGQQIVVATSAYRDLTDGDYNEVRTIKAIDKSGKRIQVTEPFEWYHYAGSEHQVEVGLLSRRITMHGDSQSEDEQFGGHVRVTGEGRFSGVQSYKMGQRNMLGKYPFHFHAMGPSPASFIKDCSIVNSYFRCIAIHQTNDTQALRNVVFNATAHCYYLEDGVEENNTLSYNLAVRVNVIGTPMAGSSQIGDTTNESDDLILPADSAAAGFYITNAYNTFIGNAASGGWAGFSFPNVPTPIGISRYWPQFPEKRPTLAFVGNTAHSSGYTFPGGGCIYVGGYLWYPTGSDLLRYNNGRYARDTLTADNSGPGIMFYNDTKTWLCNMGISHWGKRIEIISFESHDSGRSVQVFGEAWFTKALVNVKSNALVTYSDYSDVPSGFQFYDVNVKSLVSDVIFRGFTANSPAWDFNSSTSPATWNDKRVFTSLIHSDAYKPQGISATINLKFEDSDRTQFFGHKYMETGSARYTNFVDWDGSFGGTAGKAQILGDGRGWWNYDKDCVFEPDWVLHRCPRGTREVVWMNMLIPGVIDNNGEDLTDMDPAQLYIGQSHLFGPGLPTGSHNATVTRDYGVSGISKMGWYFDLNGGAPVTFTLYPGVFPTGQWAILSFRYPASTSFTITLTKKGTKTPFTVSLATSFAAMMATTNGQSYYFDTTTNHFYLKVLNSYDSDSGYTRDGVTIWDVSKNSYYTVTANCGTGTYCAAQAYLLPTVTW